MKHGLQKRNGSRRRGGKDRRRGFLPGIAAAVASLFVLAALSSILIEKGQVPVNGSSVIGKLCFAVASLIGCIAAVKKSDHNKLLFAALTAAGVFLPALVCCILINGREQTSVLIPLLISLSSCVLSCLLVRRRRYGYG